MSGIGNKTSNRTSCRAHTHTHAHGPAVLHHTRTRTRVNIECNGGTGTCFQMTETPWNGTRLMFVAAMDWDYWMTRYRGVTWTQLLKCGITLCWLMVRWKMWCIDRNLTWRRFQTFKIKHVNEFRCSFRRWRLELEHVIWARCMEMEETHSHLHMEKESNQTDNISISKHSINHI